MCSSYEDLVPFENTAVSVRTHTNQTHVGYLHAVDPETGTLALQTATHLHLLSPDTVFEVTKTVLQSQPPSLPTCTASSDGVPCAQLLDGLRQRRMQADVDPNHPDRICVLGGAAFVHKPFGPQTCRSENESVLRRVRTVVEQICEQIRQG